MSPTLTQEVWSSSDYFKYPKDNDPISPNLSFPPCTSKKFKKKIARGVPRPWGREQTFFLSLLLEIGHLNFNA